MKVVQKVSLISGMSQGFTLEPLARKLNYLLRTFSEKVMKSVSTLFQESLKKRFDMRTWYQLEQKKKIKQHVVIIIIWDFLDGAKDLSGKSDAIKGKYFNLLSSDTFPSRAEVAPTNTFDPIFF